MNNIDRTPSTAMIREAMAIERNDNLRAKILGKAWELRNSSMLSSTWARNDLNAVGFYRMDGR